MLLGTATALLHWGFKSVNITHKMTKKVYAMMCVIKGKHRALNGNCYGRQCN